MPTFRSIQLHPSITSIFAPSHQNQPLIETGDIGNQPSIHNDNSREHVQGQSVFTSVGTPRAVLTRDPQDLVEIVSRGRIRSEKERPELLMQIEGIRHEIALKMIKRTLTGRHVMCQRAYKMRQSKTQGLSSLSYVSMCASDLWRLDRERKKSPCVQSISSGCRAIDALLDIPNEHKHDSPSNLANSILMEDATIQEPPIGDCGLLRGHILQLTGNKGKTQLCLQLAVRSCLQTGSKVRYCFSNAGHASCALAHRAKHLFRSHHQRSSIPGKRDGRHKDRLKLLEFQPIPSSVRLTQTLALLERELLDQYETQKEGETGGMKDQKSPTHTVNMLILDALPWMIIDSEEQECSSRVERWLKRLSRQHSIAVIVTGTGSTSPTLLESPDTHLHMLSCSPTTTSIRLMAHPAKIVKSKDYVEVLHTNNFGITTQE